MKSHPWEIEKKMTFNKPFEPFLMTPPDHTLGVYWDVRLHHVQSGV